MHEKGSKVVQFMSDTLIRNNVNIPIQVQAVMHDGKESILATIEPGEDYSLPIEYTFLQGPLRLLVFRGGDDSLMYFSQRGYVLLAEISRPLIFFDQPADRFLNRCHPARLKFEEDKVSYQRLECQSVSSHTGTFVFTLGLYTALREDLTYLQCRHQRIIAFSAPLKVVNLLPVAIEYCIRTHEGQDIARGVLQKGEHELVLKKPKIEPVLIVRPGKRRKAFWKIVPTFLCRGKP